MPEPGELIVLPGGEQSDRSDKEGQAATEGERPVVKRHLPEVAAEEKKLQQTRLRRAGCSLDGSPRGG